jgi:hypothetical protein
MKKCIVVGLLMAVAWLPIVPSQPAVAQELPPPVTMAAPKNGRLTVRLVNQTNATITYQAVGDTNLRDLAKGATANLLNLRTPINLTFSYRDVITNFDDQEALIQAIVINDPQTGILEVTLQPTINPQLGKAVVSVDANGAVYAY